MSAKVISATLQYTPYQLRAHCRTCAKEALEVAAKLCDERAVSVLAKGRMDLAEEDRHCASAIRLLIESLDT